MKLTKERLKQIIQEEVERFQTEVQEKEIQVGDIISYLVRRGFTRSNYRINKVPDEVGADYEMTRVEIDDEGNVTKEAGKVTILGNEWEPIQVYPARAQYNKSPAPAPTHTRSSGYPKWMGYQK